MKVLMLSLWIIWMPLFLQAQDTISGKHVNRNNYSLDLSGGYSVALGKYASTDYRDSKSGYASGGWLTSLTFNWVGNKGFGVSLQYTFQRNQYQDTAKTIIPDGTKYPLGTEGWMNHYLLGGFGYLGTFSKVLVEARLMGGLLFSSASVFNMTEPGTGDNSKGYGSGFGMAFSAGAGYEVARHLAVKINVSVMGGWPQKTKSYPSQLVGYEKILDPVTGLETMVPVYSAPVEFEIKKVITTINPTAGIIYRF